MDLFAREIFLTGVGQKKDAAIKVTWAYPSGYRVGMAGLGYQLIWWLLEQEPDLSVRRTFTDTGERGWQQSDLLGFTLSWELDIVNVLSIIKKAGIPLLASQRQIDDPLVFGGGPVLTANPEPFAEIFDVILLGDAEITIPDFIQAWREARFLPDRKARLAHLSRCPGLYVPGLYHYLLDDAQGPLLQIEAETGAKAGSLARQVYNAPSDYLAHSVILSPDSVWPETFLLELTRSCPQECRFCLASYLTRPFRFANIQTVMQKIEFARKYTNHVGLIGASVSDHPGFAELAESLLKLSGLELSIASIRMDTINQLLLKTLVTLGQRSVTIALESGSERLRRLARKNLSDSEIFQGMDLIAESGIEQVKFYGMVGLPGETQEDLDETVRLLSSIKKKYRRLRLVFGLSSFVPKAQTPFQWSARDRDCASRSEFLRKNLAGIGIDVRIESSAWSDIQTLLSRADRRITPVLLELYQEKASLGAWKKAFRQKSAVCPGFDFYVFREIPDSEYLPWSHLMDSPRLAMLRAQKQLFQKETGNTV